MIQSYLEQITKDPALLSGYSQDARTRVHLATPATRTSSSKGHAQELGFRCSQPSRAPDLGRPGPTSARPRCSPPFSSFSPLQKQMTSLRSCLCFARFLSASALPVRASPRIPLESPCRPFLLLVLCSAHLFAPSEPWLRGLNCRKLAQAISLARSCS